MKYDNIKEGTFISRPNRFIANIEIDGSPEVCHVKNTGRCRELLLPGAKVYVQEADNKNRKTKYDLISVYKEDRLINIDSQIPNKVLKEWLLKGNLFKDITLIKAESTYHSSRFDFYVEADNRKSYIEVKGVTLEENGVVRFPDAPTERGVKHIQELCDCIEDGYDAYIVFIIQMTDVRYFTPNITTHKAFGEALSTAEKKGVKIIALDCSIEKNSIQAEKIVEVRL